jgi:hypothetical protein
MKEQIKKIWNDHGFIILVIISIITIIVLSIIKKGSKGTWSDSYSYNKGLFNKSYKPSYMKSPSRNPKESKGEVECRRVLQKLFNKPFPNIRPDFLRNPVTGGNFNMELDCYNNTLKLAVEYNGVQHYKYVPYFHKNKEAFRNQCYRDELKRRMCNDNDVNLIEVPYTIAINDIENFLCMKLKLLGYI